MEVVSSRDTLAAIPARMARAIRCIAEREGIPVAAFVKRLLQDALAAEGEIELTTRPRPKPKSVFSRIVTGVVDDDLR
jgi:hypothetical protein